MGTDTVSYHQSVICRCLEESHRTHSRLWCEQNPCFYLPTEIWQHFQTISCLTGLIQWHILSTATLYLKPSKNIVIAGCFYAKYLHIVAIVEMCFQWNIVYYFSFLICILPVKFLQVKHILFWTKLCLESDVFCFCFLVYLYIEERNFLGFLVPLPCSELSID